MLIDLATNVPLLLEPCAKIIVPTFTLESEALLEVGPLELNDRLVYFVELFTATVRAAEPLKDEMVILSPDTFVTRPNTTLAESPCPKKPPPPGKGRECLGPFDPVPNQFRPVELYFPLLLLLLDKCEAMTVPASKAKATATIQAATVMSCLRIL